MKISLCLAFILLFSAVFVVADDTTDEANKYICEYEGNIQMSSSSHYGTHYLWSPWGTRIENTTEPTNAMIFQFTLSSNSTPFSIYIKRYLSTLTPALGLCSDRGDASEIGPGKMGNDLTFCICQETAPFAIPAYGDNRIDTYAKKVESAVWYLHPNNTIVPQWINTNGSTPPTTSTYMVDTLYSVYDPERFRKEHGNKSMQIVGLKFLITSTNCRIAPTAKPTNIPTEIPTQTPTQTPTITPTVTPTITPTETATEPPVENPPTVSSTIPPAPTQEATPSPSATTADQDVGPSSASSTGLSLFLLSIVFFSLF